MGSILSCTCKNCQYNEGKIYFGSGRRQGGGNFFPACNFNENKVVHIDISPLYEIEDRKRIKLKADMITKTEQEGIVPYFSKKLYKKRLFLFTGKIISKEPLYLQSKFNFCPACKKYRLAFTEGGFFD
jgi:hypothetical protein